MSLPSIEPYALPLAHELPRSRVRWQPDARRAALLVHDMQSYFVRIYPSGREPMATALTRMGELVSACRAGGVPVLFSAQPADPRRADRQLLEDVWGQGLTAYPEQAAIVPALAPRPGEVVVVKTRYSAFHQTELADTLAALGRDQLWICGVYGHIGCMVTAFDAFMRNVKPFLALDAVMDFTREEHLLAGRLVAERCGRVVMARELLESTTTRAPEWCVRLVHAALEPLVDLEGCAPESELSELGLDSVRRMELAERLREAGVETDVASLLDCQRIEQLYELVRSHASDGVGRE